MKKLHLIIALACTLFLSSCAQIQHTIDNNPYLIDRAVAEATDRYINGEADKAQRVIEVATTLRAAVDEDADVSTDAIVSTLKSKIDWQSMDLAQQAVLQGVLYAVEQDLRERRRSDALVNVRRLLDVMIAEASTSA